MRKMNARPARGTTSRNQPAMSLPDMNAGSGRVPGVAFGAPGPRINLDQVLESWRLSVTTGGAAQPTPTAAASAAPAERTVSLADGTTISFASARRYQAAD